MKLHTSALLATALATTLVSSAEDRTIVHSPVNCVKRDGAPCDSANRCCGPRNCVAGFCRWRCEGHYGGTRGDGDWCPPGEVCQLQLDKQYHCVKD
ncbi:unnamed protein product [Zymoseptoria tritici ST99CH_1A5]|uniref:Uncharacterized protein n=1 Tax=Zymoseptoria tritici ST99CH_1A5 TaxID=1276529 RepID=A0A1Y6LF20_ZYMTR|nr:unnamed protein product [Zymoseptoria tritici ST99CH_1A5]